MGRGKVLIYPKYSKDLLDKAGQILAVFNKRTYASIGVFWQPQLQWLIQIRATETGKENAAVNRQITQE